MTIRIALVNELRTRIQKKTKTIGEGESVALLLLWSFLLDHAQAHGIDVEQLAREQIEALIKYARENVWMERPH